LVGNCAFVSFSIRYCFLEGIESPQKTQTRQLSQEKLDFKTLNAKYSKLELAGEQEVVFSDH